MQTPMATRLACWILGFTLITWAAVAAASTVQVSPHDAKVQAAMEPFEALAETALTQTHKQVAKAYQAAHASRASARALLPAAQTAAFDASFAQLDAANGQHDFKTASLAAAELYKQMVLSVEAPAPASTQVNLLDYAGFRLAGLLHATPDWPAIAMTAQEANGNWAAIRGQVGDAHLRARMDAAQQQLAVGANRKDAKMLKPAIKQDLDLVDALEIYFAKHPRRAGKQG
jgi:hypothetical protein